MLSIFLTLLACGEKSIDTASILEPSTEPSMEASSEDTTNPDDTTTDTSSGNDTSDQIPDSAQPTAFQETGLFTFSSSTGSASLSNCDSPMNYTKISTSNSNAPTVFIAHGFFRSSANMIEWAEHFGTWGLNAVAVDMCNFSDHQKNGLALAELSTQMGVTEPLFMGFSAGGLASLVAASETTPMGILTLDAVDDMSGTGGSISSVNATLLSLVGVGSNCNSQNNVLPALQGLGATKIFRVTDADHCDFEAPTDAGCDLLCGNSMATLSDDEIRSTVRGMATAAMMWMSGIDDSGADWWTGSQNQYLQSQGFLQPL